MRSKGNMGVAVVCLTLLGLLASCDTVAVHRRSYPGPGIGHGPPAHAKAHGYRNQHVCGYELIYDADCDLYVVVGLTDCYYHDGYFYRLHGDVWEISLRADTWELVSHDRLPFGLRAKTTPAVKVVGNGHSVVKLNGGGNSLVKLNGNQGGGGRGPSLSKGRK